MCSRKVECVCEDILVSATLWRPVVCLCVRPWRLAGGSVDDHAPPGPCTHSTHTRGGWGVAPPAAGGGFRPELIVLVYSADFPQNSPYPPHPFKSVHAVAHVFFLHQLSSFPEVMVGSSSLLDLVYGSSQWLPRPVPPFLGIGSARDHASARADAGSKAPRGGLSGVGAPP